MTEHDEFSLRLLRVAIKYEFVDDLFWNDIDGKITAMVNCNDVFDYATAEGVDIGPNDLDDLARACEDAIAVGKRFYGPILFAARKEKRRPLKAFMARLPELTGLFAECGPEREW